MSYDPRTIAFLAEVYFQPIQLQAKSVQNIHNALYDRPELSYQNFQVAHDGIHLTNVAQTPGSVSAITFLPDRMVLREELRGVTVEDFVTRLVNVTSLSFRTLGIPQTTAQQFIVRSLVNPRSFKDSTEFLTRAMLQSSDEALGRFERPINSMGFRLTFPQTDNSPEVFNLRIETWHQDPRSLWIENTGSFRTATTADNLPVLGDHLYSTYKFVIGPAGRFLAHFDR